MMGGQTFTTSWEFYMIHFNCPLGIRAEAQEVISHPFSDLHNTNLSYSHHFCSAAAA